MKKKILLAILLMLVGVNGVVGLSYYIHGDNGLKGNYVNLIPPPPEALASDFGSPLVTVDIGLFAYYEAADWDLNDVIPAFQTYTQYSNYVDGTVRVFSSERGTSFEGDQHNHDAGDPAYIDVQVRVRSDGWILAWLTDTQNKAFICHWGDNCRDGTDPINAILTPVDYSTCLARAFYRVYHNAGVSWIGYDVIKYYDYEYSDAIRLYVFGDFTEIIAPSSGAKTEYFYFIVPTGITIEAGWLGGAGKTWSGADDIDLDEVDKMSLGWTDNNGWNILDITGSISVGTRHSVKLSFLGSAVGEHIACCVMIWTS